MRAQLLLLRQVRQAQRLLHLGGRVRVSVELGFGGRLGLGLGLRLG